MFGTIITIIMILGILGTEVGIMDGTMVGILGAAVAASTVESAT